MSLKSTTIEIIIETLLQKHECVILPDFGGFIVRDSPCNFNVAKDQIKPFARHIFFNPHLKENDGLLLNAIQKSEGLDYAEAQSVCKQAIEDLKRSIAEKGSEVFGILGTFFQGQENIWFAPSTTLNLSIDSYGLGPVDVKNLQILEQTRTENAGQLKKVEPVFVTADLADRKPIESTEKKKSGAKAWLIAASVALLVHFVYLGIEYKSEDHQQASVLPELVQSEASSPEINLAEESPESLPLDTAIENQDAAAIANERSESEAITSPEETPQSVEQEVVPEVKPNPEIPNEEIIQVAPLQERVLVRYLMEANARYHSSDLNKKGQQTRVEKNGEWYEVRSSEPQVQ